jgi:hypothetical protein
MLPILVVMILKFNEEALDEVKAQQDAWNRTHSSPSSWNLTTNSTIPDFPPVLSAYQSGIIIAYTIFMSFWTYGVLWFFIRKVVLIVDKRSRLIQYRMTRYFCNCCWDNTEMNNSENNNNNAASTTTTTDAEDNDVKEVCFSFERVHSVQMKRSGGKGALDTCAVKIFYYPRGYTAENYKPSQQQQQLPPLRSVVVGTMVPSMINPLFRSWKRYLIEDLNISLKNQPEDIAFAALRQAESSGQVNVGVAPIKQLDPNLYVVDGASLEEAEDKSPLIM